MSTRDVTDATFEADVLKSEKTIMVDFWAPWCGPCRAVSPILDQIASENADKIDIVKLNTDENMQVSSRYGITGIPTLNVYVGDPEELAEVRWVSLAEADDLLPGMFEPVRDHLVTQLSD